MRNDIGYINFGCIIVIQHEEKRREEKRKGEDEKLHSANGNNFQGQ